MSYLRPAVHSFLHPAASPPTSSVGSPAKDDCPMPMQANEIEALLRETFPDAQITVEGHDGVHMAAMVVDESFRSKNRVQQQRAVYAALKGKMDGAHGELHALALTTKAPD